MFVGPSEEGGQFTAHRANAAEFEGEVATGMSDVYKSAHLVWCDLNSSYDAVSRGSMDRKAVAILA
jgi:hypothetical protein